MLRRKFIQMFLASGRTFVRINPLLESLELLALVVGDSSSGGSSGGGSSSSGGGFF